MEDQSRASAETGFVVVCCLFLRPALREKGEQKKEEPERGSASRLLQGPLTQRPLGRSAMPWNVLF